MSEARGGKVRLSWLTEAARLFAEQAGAWLGVTVLLLTLSAFLTVVFALLINAATGPSPSSSASNPWDMLLGWDVLAGGSHLIVTSLLSGGIYRMAARQVRGEPIRFRDVFHPGGTGLRLTGFCLLWGACVGAGLVFLILPGLLVAGLLLPAFALIADGAGVFEAISRSLSATARHAPALFGLTLLLTVLLALAVPPCLLGLLLVQPLLWLLSPLAVRDLIDHPAEMAALPPDFGLPQEGVWPPPPSARTEGGQEYR